MIVERIMGIDFGKKNVGIALSDALGITAQPLKVFQRTNLKKDLRFITELCEEFCVTEIVLGYPLNMNGSPGPAAQAASLFRDKLADFSGLPVHLWDERLSSVQSDRILLEGDVRREKRKKLKDIMAATLILESFLSARKKIV